MRQLDSGQRLEKLDREMAGTADAAGSVADLSRIGARIGNEFLRGTDGQRMGHDQRVRRGADIGDRRQIAQGVVRQIGVEAGVEGEPLVHHHQRVAVARRLGDLIGADRAASPALVFNDERLAQLVPQSLADQARDDVHAAARGERHDDVDRSCGPGLRNGRDRAQQCGEDGDPAEHGRHQA